MSENQLNQVSEKSESKFTSAKDANSGLSASLWEEIGRMQQSSNGAGATVEGDGLQHAPDKVPSQEGGTKPETADGNSNSNSDSSVKVPRDGGVKDGHEDQHGSNTKPEYNERGKPTGDLDDDKFAGKKMIQEERDGIVKPIKPYDSFDNGIKPVKPNMEDGIVKPGIKKPPVKPEGPVCDKDSLQGFLEFAPLKFN